MRRLLAVTLALLCAAPAQQPPPPGGVVFKTTSTLVVVNVAVRDRAGQPLESLKKEDFVLTENGQPQAISVFEFQRLSFDALPPEDPFAEVQSDKARPADPLAEAAPAKAANVIAAPKPGELQYRDKRLLVMLFDFSGMPEADQLRAQEAALEFLDKRLTKDDRVAILTNFRSLKVEQDFTGDRAKLREVIEKFPIGDMAMLAEGETPDAEEPTDEGAIAVDETEFNIFNTDRKLGALESAARMLAPLPEKKALIYFSGGVNKTGAENQSQLRATINAAVRANVAFYPIDVRGLVALPPGGGANQAMARGSAIFSGRAQRQQREKFNDAQETLVTLAADTGGKAMLDTNDIAAGIVQAQQDVRSYYILGYYSTNPAPDGRFRRVQVKVAGNEQARLSYRSGYFAPKEFGKFNANDKEQQLQDALAMGDPITDLPLALETDYFRVAKGQYFVPMSVKIPGAEIHLSQKGKSGAVEFDFIGQIRNEKGQLSAAVRDAIKVKLDEGKAALLARRHLQYDAGFTLPPGRYRIKFLARENETGKMGTFETTFAVPDLDESGALLRVSSAIWSSQREPLSEAVGAAEKKNKQAANPLVQDGQKLVPSITRVFRRDQNLYVYLEVYDPVREGIQPPSVAASLSFFRGKEKVYESAPLRVKDTLRQRTGVVALRFQMPLKQFQPGEYVAQINAIDEQGHKFAFPRAPLVILR